MPHVEILKNGLAVITVSNPQVESVATVVVVGAGSRYETKLNKGIAHFGEHMFFKGSKKFPQAKYISYLIEEHGADNNASTGKEYTDYWIHSSKEQISLASDVLSSMLKEPLIASDEVEKEKGVVIEELRRGLDNPSTPLVRGFANLRFGDQPLGWPVIGEEETINSFTRENLIGYIDSLYSPTNMALVYVGKLPKNINKIADQYFSSLPSRAKFKALPYIKTQSIGPKVDIYEGDTHQVQIILGGESYEHGNNKGDAANLLAYILGQGMSSRLFMAVREDKSLAYSISASHYEYADTGSFSIHAGLNSEKIINGMEIIKGEIDKITASKVTDRELARARAMIKGEVSRENESSVNLAVRLGMEYVLDRDNEPLAYYFERLDSVSKDEILDAAQEVFDKKNLNLQMNGSLKDKEPFYKILAAA